MLVGGWWWLVTGRRGQWYCLTTCHPLLPTGCATSLEKTAVRSRCLLLSCALVVGIAVPIQTGEPKKAAPAAVGARVDEIDKRLNAEYASLETLYKHLHANPELSFHEEQTAVRMAQELKKLGF